MKIVMSITSFFHLEAKWLRRIVHNGKKKIVQLSFKIYGKNVFQIGSY